MYRKSDRERILCEFRASGKTAAAFCADPARPSRGALRRWLEQEARGELDVPEAHVPGRCDHVKHSHYPRATVDEAVRLVGGGMSPADAARRLGVSDSGRVRDWCRRAKTAKMAPEKEVAMGKRRTPGRSESLPLREARAMGRRELEEAYAEERLRSQVLLEVMRDPKAPCPERLSNRRKAELGQRLRRDFGFSLSSVLTCFRISRSTYYDNVAALGEPGPSEREEEVDALVAGSFARSGGTYGYRRVHADLRRRSPGARVSEREVRSSMSRQSLVARKTRAPRGYSSYGGEPDERPANVPLGPRGRHDFTCASPGDLVVTDVTEFKVGGARVYLSPVIDCFDGMPVAHSVSLHPDSALCDGSLALALERGPVGTVHTDGGSCYRSASWKALCEENGVARSMGRKANCGDNARAEGFFGTLKEEFFHGREWDGVAPEEFSRELDGYIEWYRNGRLKAFREGGATVYDTLAGRRARLGYAA